MKRPLLVVGVAFAAATWGALLCPGLPALPLSGLCALAGLGVYALRRSARVIPVALLSASLALACFTLYRERSVLPLEQMAGETVRAQGMVIEATRANPGFILTVRAGFPEEELPGAVLRVRGYGELEYAPGDGISCLLRLEELPGSKSYYHSRGIFTSARLLEAQPHTRLNLPQAAEGLVLRLRSRMTENLYTNLNPETAGVMSAMALGEWGGIGRADSDALSRAGTIHLLSVSGLHLSILVGCVAALLKRLGLGERATALGSMAASLAFALLVGLSPSITRALVMMLLMLSARLISRRSDSLNSLGLALLLICILAPHWMLSRGLWLSCTSTAGIVSLSGPLHKRIADAYASRGRVARRLAQTFLGAGAVAVSAYAFSFPVLLVTSGWVSLLSPVANILVAPLAAPALVCGMLCALFVPFAPAAWLCDLCVGLILSLSRLVASLPLLSFSLDEFWKLLWLLLAVGVVFLLVRWRAGGRLWRYGAALLALSFAAGSMTLYAARRDRVELAALQGCSAVVLLRQGSAVVVGTPSPYEIGALSSYLEYRGIKALDAVIASDCGEQIGSGMLRLAADFAPGMVLGPDDDYILAELARALPEAAVMSSGYATIEVLGGVALRVDGVTGEIQIAVGDNLIVKSREEYAIMDGTGSEVRIWKDGILIWTQDAPPAFEPMGDLLFGERRLILRL